MSLSLPINSFLNYFIEDKWRLDEKLILIPSLVIIFRDLSKNNLFFSKKIQNNICFKIMSKLMFPCHVTKTVVVDYSFKKLCYKNHS